MMTIALLETNLGSLPLTARGKVRDIYALPNEQLLFVATDRISAFDHATLSLLVQLPSRHRKKPPHHRQYR
jgi:SAICAR synthetase